MAYELQSERPKRSSWRGWCRRKNEGKEGDGKEQEQERLTVQRVYSTSLAQVQAITRRDSDSNHVGIDTTARLVPNYLPSRVDHLCRIGEAHIVEELNRYLGTATNHG